MSAGLLDRSRIKNHLRIFPIFGHVEILPGIAPSHSVLK